MPCQEQCQRKDTELSRHVQFENLRFNFFPRNYSQFVLVLAVGDSGMVHLYWCVLIFFHMIIVFECMLLFFIGGRDRLIVFFSTTKSGIIGDTH